MTIYTELSRIQKELKAPKGQYNTFGNYKYRSCEDILEAAKPLLGECSLTINDEIVLIGDRFYIKATAKLSLTNDEFITNSALAREPEGKKGMDEAQVTGATSSYARKYALNGLFAIDDTKDADATNTHGKDDPKPAPAPKDNRTLTERYEAGLKKLKSLSSDEYNQMKPEHKTAFNNLVKELSDCGSAGWAENILSEITRLTAVDASLNFLEGDPKQDYRI